MQQFCPAPASSGVSLRHVIATRTELAELVTSMASDTHHVLVTGANRSVAFRTKQAFPYR